MRFLQGPALSLSKGWAAMLPAQILSFLRYRFVCGHTRPSQSTRRTGHTQLWRLLISLEAGHRPDKVLQWALSRVVMCNSAPKCVYN